jgi:hypothetical protein
LRYRLSVIGCRIQFDNRQLTTDNCFSGRK